MRLLQEPGPPPGFSVSRGSVEVEREEDRSEKLQSCQRSSLNSPRSTENTTAVWLELYGPIRWENNIFQPLQRRPRDAEAHLEASMTGRSQNSQVLSGTGVPARSGLQLSTINIRLAAPWESFPAIISELLSECAGLRVHPDSSFSLFQPVRH